MPPRSPKHPPVVIASAEIVRIKELYLEGRYRAAYDVGAAHGPIAAWAGPAARLMAGRLAMQLGAPRLGRQLHAVAYRESPAYLETVYYHARYLLEAFGPYSCWCFSQDQTEWNEAAPEIRADWFALQAFVSARFRDFDRAEKFLAQSEQIAPNRPWHHVERSSVLELQDKLSDAVVAAKRSLEIQPLFRPGVQSLAHLNMRLGNDATALEILTEAAEKLESSLVLAQLAGLQMDLGLFREAEVSLQRYEDLAPLIDKETREWLAARRADVAYRLGDYTTAMAQARQVAKDDKFYPAFATRLGALAEQQAAERIVHPLDSSFDKNAPGALELLGRFWNLPVPKPQKEAGPAVDGLPDVTDRIRFEAAGWVAREFTLDFDTAAELLRRGVPVLATLFETGYGQLRLFAGFDVARQSLFVFEQGERKVAEAPMHLIQERFGATGPRALVLVPAAQSAKLDGVAFADAAEYDSLFKLQKSLHGKKFDDGKAALTELQRKHHGHRTALLGALAWAKATAHPMLQLEATEALLQRYPKELAYSMVKSNMLRELGRQNERTEFLRVLCADPDADAVVLQSYSQAVIGDPDEAQEADRLLRRSIRLRPHAPAGYYLLGALLWETRVFGRAVELNRMASCLDDTEEQFAQSYVRTARANGSLTDAMRLLQRRSAQSDTPTDTAVRTHVWALFERGEPEYAWSALEKGIEKLAPTDGKAASPEYLNLRLHEVELLANAGKFTEAEKSLADLRNKAEPAAWYRTAARVARGKPQYREALAHVRSWLDHLPQDNEALRLYIALLADVEGKASAKLALAELANRNPHDYTLLRTRSEFLSSESEMEEALVATEVLLKLCPRDAWAERQMALIQTDLRHTDEALAAIERSALVEARHPAYYAIRANALRRADRTEEAVESFKDGLAVQVDHELSIVELVRASRGNKEKKAALQFIYEQLQHQGTNGDGLVSWRDQSLQVMEDPEDQERLYTQLEWFLDERPDLWASWSLMTQQLLMMHRADEAYTLGKDATARFPLLARLWLDLAEACRMSNHPEERLEALRQALRCAPGWTQVARELSEALADQNDYDEAIALLEQNATRTPMDPAAHGQLAERYWNSDRSEEALERAERAVRLEPGYDWAWQAVANWGERLERPNAVIDLSRDLAQDRSGDARVHMKLARSLYRYEQTDEALAALDKAIAIEPKNPEPHDLKAERLADVGRYDEAIEAANPADLLDDAPIILKGRASWVEARRGNYGRAIPMMQALVAVDPGYYWGWSQLAEWYNEIGKSSEYLDAADELIRLRPDHPAPLTMRGEAKMQTDDREGGKEDLREALRLHPSYSPAAAILFDACLADEELREARGALSVLQEHMTGPEVVLKQLLYCVRTKDEEAAVRAFRELCEQEGEGPPTTMQQAMFEMRLAGYDERALTVLHEAWTSGEPFNPWAGLFWMDTVDDEDATPEQKIEAVDAVIKRYPEFIPAFDRKAELLTRQAEYDAAKQACLGTKLKPTPLTLRGRIAWIDGQAGNYEDAIKGMKACLEEDPDYTWGWRQLAHWYDDAKQPKEYLESAEQLVRLAPGDPYSYGIRGEAKRLLGDHRGARDDYQHAYELDPNFEAAGFQLLTQQIATDDLDGAAKTLEAMRENSDGPLLTLRAVQLATRQNDLGAAKDALRKLACDENVARMTLREAAETFEERQWSGEADSVLGDLLVQPEATPVAAAVWVERHVTTGQGWKVGDRLKELVEKNPDVGREAVLVYAWALAVGSERERATATIQRFSDILRKDVVAWGRAGMTLGEAKRHALAQAWLSDWKEREEVEAWMLRPLADAHRLNGEFNKADAVILESKDLEDEDDLPDDFIAWLGIRAGLNDQHDDAKMALAQLTNREVNGTTMLLVATLRAIVTTRNTGDKAKAFDEAKKLLAEAAKTCPRGDYPVGLGKLYPAIVKKIVANVGGWKARFWGWMQKFKPLITEAV